MFLLEKSYEDSYSVEQYVANHILTETKSKSTCAIIEAHRCPEQKIITIVLTAKTIITCLPDILEFLEDNYRKDYSFLRITWRTEIQPQDKKELLSAGYVQKRERIYDDVYEEAWLKILDPDEDSQLT